MFTTVEEVRTLTGYEVNDELILRAQAIIESVVNKVEAEVESAGDRMLLGRAVAFQAAYMRDNYERVYEQMAVVQIAQTDGSVTLDTGLYSPYLAPLAMLALRNLSWMRSRSVRTGSIGGAPRRTRWETE